MRVHGDAVLALVHDDGNFFDAEPWPVKQDEDIGIREINGIVVLSEEFHDLLPQRLEAWGWVGDFLPCHLVDDFAEEPHADAAGNWDFVTAFA